MSEATIESITKSDSSFAPTFVDCQLLPDMNFNEHCLIKNIPTPKKIINLYISYTLGPQLRDFNRDFTLGNFLFGSVKLTENADSDKYSCSSYVIGFDTHREYSLPEGIEQVKMLLFLELI